MSINNIDINNEFLVYINNFFDGKFKLVNKIDKFSCDNLSFFEKKLLVSEWIRKIYMTDFSIEGAKKKVKNSYGDLIENNKTRFYSEIFKYYLRSIYYDFLPICILNYGEMNKDLFELKNKMNKWLKDKKFEGYSLYVQGGYRSWSVIILNLHHRYNFTIHRISYTSNLSIISVIIGACLGS